MGWVKEPTLEAGERILGGFSANRSQGARAVGGKLWVTTTHLRFTANAVDRRAGGRDWSTPITGVEDVGAGNRTLKGGPFSGGVRKRLAVMMKDGSQEAFVVNNVNAAVMALQPLL